METYEIVLIVVGSALAVLILILLKQYFNGGVCRIVKDLTGQVIFITGANGGIGEQTAYKLAEMGATIIIACRDMTKAQPVLNRLQNIVKNNTENYLIPLDLSDLVSVRNCVEEFKKLNLQKIDVLINNAGVMATPTYVTTKQGFEMQFGTNHLGHFYLTELLVPFLRKSQKPRLINVSSIAHSWAQMNLDDLNWESQAQSTSWGTTLTWAAYGNSKLSNLLHALEFSHKHNIEACSLHPGAVRTGLSNTFISNGCKKVLYCVSYPFWYYFSKDSIQGAQTTLYCTLADTIYDGGYYKDCKLAIPDFANRQLSKGLWERSEAFITSKMEQYP